MLFQAVDSMKNFFERIDAFKVCHEAQG